MGDLMIINKGAPDMVVRTDTVRVVVTQTIYEETMHESY